jgi:hypothetical protein
MKTDLKTRLKSKAQIKQPFKIKPVEQKPEAFEFTNIGLTFLSLIGARFQIA